MGPTSATISWTLQNGEVPTNYTLFYWNINNAHCFNNSGCVDDIGAYDRKYTLIGLQEDTVYSVILRVAFSKDMTANDSLVITTKTAGQSFTL